MTNSLAKIFLFFLLLCSPVAGQEAATEPNIVIFLADDLNYCDIGCYGNPDVKTPAIDRLATQGMRFTRAYTATAMCGPTRMQLYTGIYPVRSGGFPNHSRVKDGTKSIVHHLADQGYRVALSNKGHVGPKESFPFEIIKGMDVEGWREFMTRDRNQPFCIAVCSSQPHEPWNQGDASLYEPDQITVPAFMFDNQETREALCRYYGEVTYLDQELDSCLKILETEQLEQNTIVLFSSEQGAGVPNSKWTCYDLGLRVALVARWPGMIKAGSTTNAMVNYVDIVPTLLDILDCDPRQYDFDGTSFKDVLLGKSDVHNRLAFGVHTQTNAIGAPDTGYPVRSVRNERYKYIVNENSDEMFSDHIVVADPERFFFSWREAADGGNEHAKALVDKYLFRPREELYDLEQDPYELNNLIAVSSHSATVAELKHELKKWMAQQGDLGHETELEVIRGRDAAKKANDKKKTDTSSGN